MNKNKKIRRLSHLIEKYHAYYIYDEDLIEFLDRRIQSCLSFKWHTSEHKDARAFQEIKKIVLELKIDKEEYIRIYQERLKNHPKFDVNLNTIKETRDNKGIYIGSGGSNRNSVRYPKKKRSKKVWDTFYRMFPRYAEKDGYKIKKDDNE